MSNERPGGHGERSVAAARSSGGSHAHRSRVEGDRQGWQLAVDANGRFDLETAIANAKILRDYPPFSYEEAGDLLDFLLQAALSKFYPAP